MAALIINMKNLTQTHSGVVFTPASYCSSISYDSGVCVCVCLCEHMCVWVCLSANCAYEWYIFSVMKFGSQRKLFELHNLCIYTMVPKSNSVIYLSISELVQRWRLQHIALLVYISWRNTLTTYYSIALCILSLLVYTCVYIHVDAFFQTWNFMSVNSEMPNKFDQ